MGDVDFTTVSVDPRRDHVISLSVFVPVVILSSTTKTRGAKNGLTRTETNNPE